MSEVAKKDELVWEAYEYHHHERSSDWYWALGIIAVSIAVTSILLKNILFAIVILLSAFTLALFAHRKPERITMKLGATGIFMGRRFHTYSEIESFWMEDRDNDPRIIFKPMKNTRPFTVFPVEGVPSDTIRAFLGKYLPEEELEEPLSQKIMEYLGF